MSAFGARIIGGPGGAERVGEMVGAGATRRARTSDGSWRPDLPFNTNHGLKITMRRAAGVTPPGVLSVPLRFQVPAMGEFRRPYRFNWATFDTVGAGQGSKPMGAQLLDIQIDTMLLDQIAADSSYGIVVWDGVADPERIIDELRFIAGADAARKGPAAPFRLVVDQPAVWQNPLVNIIATLTSVEPAIPSGEVGTQYLSAGFLEYQPEKSGAEQYKARRDPTTHTLKSDDTLHGLAVRFLHQASAWKQIANLNGISGVSPSSAADLASWAKRHHVKSIKIPAVEFQARRSGGQVGAGAS